MTHRDARAMPLTARLAPSEVPHDTQVPRSASACRYARVLSQSGRRRRLRRAARAFGEGAAHGRLVTEDRRAASTAPQISDVPRATRHGKTMKSYAGPCAAQSPGVAYALLIAQP